ncbi:hypothetical protein RB614_07220 [Phytohabitans sp. ZYX-F-186]|uniref:Uncharacterized protein n=1 Tax=Phytohabitans maris TaxID=3071409 RepID=A0ABU0ZED7_9ACTN|nr:hypothetical protein [Phytohabitans sp. ZYX-F-186]MDQ7904312.1 hypothetical protein [Phytohabitans sp. ZYX-F-186]
MHVQPVPLPSGEPAAVLDGVARWITSTPLRDLVTAFGGQWPGGDSPSLLGWLDAFSAAHWDFRGGAERPDAVEPDLDPEVATLVTASAEALGMVGAKPPPRRDYRHVLVLGGLAHACLRRTAYAAHLLHRGTVAGGVGVLGSFRPLSPAERALPPVDGCRSEVDVLDLGVRRAFKVDDPVEADDAPDGSWSVRTYAPAEGPRVAVLAAPSSEPGRRRAHTADTQRFWAKRAALAQGDRLLVVTAPIYVPFQHCDAVRTLGLPYGCAVDTIGVDPHLADELALPEPTLTPGRYLQEIRSAIRSMRLLVAALGG